jgi:hypothetical protein
MPSTGIGADSHMRMQEFMADNTDIPKWMAGPIAGLHISPIDA